MSQSKENYTIHNKNYHYLDDQNRLIRFESKRLPMNPKKVYHGIVFHFPEKVFKQDIYVNGEDIMKNFIYLGYTDRSVSL